MAVDVLDSVDNVLVVIVAALARMELVHTRKLGRRRSRAIIEVRIDRTTQAIAVVLEVAITVVVCQLAAVGVKPALTVFSVIICCMCEEETSRNVLTDALTSLRALHMLDVVENVLVVVVASLVWVESAVAA